MLLRHQRISAMAASEAEHLERTGEYSDLVAGDRFSDGEETWIVVQDELDAARGAKTRNVAERFHDS